MGKTIDKIDDDSELPLNGWVERARQKELYRKFYRGTTFKRLFSFLRKLNKIINEDFSEVKLEAF